MDFLVDNNFYLLISLDGDEKNNVYRTYPNGKKAYKEIYINSVALKNKYPDYFENQVNFSAVLHNKNSVLEIYQFFKENFGKKPQIAELSPSGINPKFIDEFNQTYKNYFEGFEDEKKCSEIEKDIFASHPLVTSTRETIFRYSGYVFRKFSDLLSLQEFKYMPTGTCMPFSRRIYVTAKGKILPCERIGHQYALGHLYRDKVEINFQRIAEMYNKYLGKLKNKCNLCYKIDGCSRCIFYLDLEKDNPSCDAFTDHRRFASEFSLAMSYLEKNPTSYARIMKEIIIV